MMNINMYGSMPYCNDSTLPGAFIMPRKKMVTTSPNTKIQRLEARVNSEQKELFQGAADLLGRSLTDFIVSTLQKNTPLSLAIFLEQVL